jgi:hypothetical protein
MHLDQRLPANALAAAAHAGLQDTAPRAALLSLHARVDGVTPDTWADSALAQVWGPRLAVYLVPAAAISAFTLGRLPRQPSERSGIDDLSARVVDALAGQPMRSNQLFQRFTDLPNPVLVRAAAAAGRILVRWDARVTWVLPIERPDIEEEDARRDLAERYGAWFGTTGGPATFARWAGVGVHDAELTWASIRPVTPPQRRRPARGARLLPYADPFLYGQPPPRTPAREIPGALLLDGAIVGTWARRQANITLRPASTVAADDIDRLIEAAHELRDPLGRPMVVAVQSDA